MTTEGEKRVVNALLGTFEAGDFVDQTLAVIGLGLGASDRARELVWKGLLYEYIVDAGLLRSAPQEEIRRKKGRPRATVSMDELRVVNLFRLRLDVRKAFAGTKPLIAFMKDIEPQVFLAAGLDPKLKIWTSTFPTLEVSVSKGLKGLCYVGDDLLRINSQDFFLKHPELSGNLE